MRELSRSRFTCLFKMFFSSFPMLRMNNPVSINSWHLKAGWLARRTLYFGNTL